MATSGAKLLTQCLLNAGVERVYGIIGTSIVAFVDGLYEAREQIQYISCRHEQVAATMADTEGRLTGRPGVVVLHSGPGALNSAISLGNAAKDCSPVIAITGAVRRKLENVSGMLQLDHLSVFAPICRAVYRVNSADRIPDIFEKAWRAALGAPPGPVLIEVPEDVWTEQSQAPESDRKFSAPEIPVASAKEIDTILSSLKSADKPLLLCGGGLAADGDRTAVRFSETLNLPVATTCNGRGVVPESHPLCLGRCGFGGGNTVADFAMENADLILAAGCTISDMSTYEFTMPVKAAVITINLDPEQNMPGVTLKQAVRADAAGVLNAVLDAWDNQETPDRSDWLSKFDAPAKIWKQMLERNVLPGKTPLSPGYVCNEIAGYMGERDIVTVGAGMHLLYPMAHIPCNTPRTFLSAVNFGAMGFGLAAGIAAGLIRPDSKVVTIIGDGDVMMTFQDLETAVRHNIPIKVFIFNDSAYRVLLVRQKVQFGGRIIGTQHGNPDFALLAGAFGARGIRLEKPEDVKDTVREVMESNDPTVVDVIIDPDDVAPTNVQAFLRMNMNT